MQNIIISHPPKGTRKHTKQDRNTYFFIVRFIAFINILEDREASVRNMPSNAHVSLYAGHNPLNLLRNLLAVKQT